MANISYSYNEEIARDRIRMAVKRSQGRDLEIPSCANPRRRRHAERDPQRWLQTYASPVFYNPFSRSQAKLVHAAWHCLTYGGWQAQSAPRGGGKSSILLYLMCLAFVKALRHFLVFIATNGPEASRRGKQCREFWELPKFALLHSDYPEISVPVQALGGSSRRAGTQTVGGQRTFIEWGADNIRFPSVPGSPASGSRIVCVGMEGGIRGQSDAELRPDAVLIDDPESRRSLRSVIETQRIEDTIETDIVGLEGPEGGMAMFMACTIAKKNCVADKFSDPKIKPAWRGERSKLVLQFPQHFGSREAGVVDLSDQYIQMRKDDRLKGDKDGRRAHQFFIDNFDVIQEGVIMDDEFRFSRKTMLDGSQAEVSPYQFALNKIADMNSMDKFKSEYQSEPPEETAPESLQLTVTEIANRLSRIPRNVVPHGCEIITAGVDVGGKTLHYTIIAWKNGIGYIIDHGVTRVFSPLTGKLLSETNIHATQAAILQALLDLKSDIIDPGFADSETGEVKYVDCTCVDSGWQAIRKSSSQNIREPVYEFIRSCPVGKFRAIKGWQDGQYRQPEKAGHGKYIGEGWHRSPQPAQHLHLYHLDSDHWKFAVHDGFNMPGDEPGALLLFGDEPLPHSDFAEEITAEEYQTIYIPGKGYESRFIRIHAANHRLDSTGYARAAAEMMGLKIAVVKPDKDVPQNKIQPETTSKLVTHNPGGSQKTSGVKLIPSGRMRPRRRF